MLQNVGKLITFVIVIYYIVSAVRGGAAAREAEEPDEETQARARQIQEEIRRKILERQTQQPGGPVARPQAEHPTALRPVMQMEEDEEEELDYRPTPVRREVAPPPLPTSTPVAAPARQASAPIMSEGENAYARQMAEIDVQIKKAEGLRQKAAEFLGSGNVSNRRMRSRAAAGEMRTRLVDDLHNRSSIKVAIALKEVLDKPVGLR